MSSTDTMTLGLAGSNTFRPARMVRLACATDVYNAKTQHIVVKRRSDAHGARQNQTYKTDADLMRRLNTWAQEHGYPTPEGYIKDADGRFVAGSSRAPVVLMSNDPAKIFQMSRQVWRSHAIVCECSEWALKDRAQCKAEGLPYPCEDPDDERYYIGTCTYHEYRQERRKKGDREWTVNIPTGTEQRVCNPSKCPHSQGQNGKAACKPTTDVQLMLGPWGGSEPAVVHSTAWATARRLPSSLALVMREVQAIAGVSIDLVLQYTEPRRNPDGLFVRQPFWSFAIPFGMTPEEFRAQAIQDAERMVADNRRMQELAATQNAMMLHAGTDYYRGGLLPEFRPEAALPPSPEPETGPLSATEAQAVTDLVHGYGYPEAAADAMVRANAEDLDAMYDRIGERQADTGEPPILEGEVLPDEPEQSDRSDQPTMFDTEPTTLKAIAERFSELGEVDVGRAILTTTRQALREQMGDAATGEALVMAYWAAAEQWWANEGAQAHVAGGAQ